MSVKDCDRIGRKALKDLLATVDDLAYTVADLRGEMAALRRAVLAQKETPPLAPSEPSGLEEFVGISTIRKTIGKDDSTLWRWLKSGKFPQPVYFGSRRMWRRSEVEAWVAARSRS